MPNDAAPHTDLLSERDLARALDDLRLLAADAMQGREVGTEGGERARTHLARALHELALRPVGGAWEHPFFWTQPDGVHRHGTNVLAWIEAAAVPERVIVASAHYDHLGRAGGETMNGADDNASGVAALLALARQWVRRPPRCSVLLAFFDGEEAELRGSTHFVLHPPLPLERVALNVNLDMLGRSRDGALWAVGTRHHARVREAVERAAEDAPVPVRFGHDRLGWLPFVEHDWTQASDQGAFHRADIPFVYFGTRNDRETHDQSDTADTIDEAFFAAALETVARAVEELDRLVADGGTR